jgi:hypothetical protein
MAKISKLGEKLSVNAQTLVDTRLLIQANSGGGKSYAIRKLLEATHGQLQQIVLDVEGDFSSLREKFDFVLAGKGGDIPATVKSAGMLARKVLELETDLIVDLYELKQHDRIKFVRLFLEEMINAPKNLWHPALIVIDEAHLFAPEKGNAESMAAVIDLCTRGRKRGYGAILATQRLSKLHKDAAAECNNKLIGRTLLDIDVKRAADELGFMGKDWTKFRTLKPGEFYAFGPAISADVVKGMIGKAETAHPVAGARIANHKAPVSSGKVKQALKELADLQIAAEEEIKTKEDMQIKIKQLSSQLSSKPAPAIDQVKMDQIIEKSISAAKNEMEKELKAKINSIKNDLMAVLSKHGSVELTRPNTSKQIQLITALPKGFTSHSKPIPAKPIEESSLGACERKILGFLATQPERSFSKVQVGAMAGYAHSSGGFNNALSRLTQAGLIIRESGMMRINPELNPSDFLNGVPHTLQDWINKLGACERSVYSFLLNHPHEAFDKNSIAESTNYAPGSGGFNNALSRLSTLGLIKRDSGKLKINDELTQI